MRVLSARATAKTIQMPVTRLPRSANESPQSRQLDQPRLRAGAAGADAFEANVVEGDAEGAVGTSSGGTGILEGVGLVAWLRAGRRAGPRPAAEAEHVAGSRSRPVYSREPGDPVTATTGVYGSRCPTTVGARVARRSGWRWRGGFRRGCRCCRRLPGPGPPGVMACGAPAALRDWAGEDLVELSSSQKCC